MWVLFLILISASGETGYAVEKFSAYAECKVEEDRLQAEMVAAYPNDKSFYLKCLIQAKETT